MGRHEISITKNMNNKFWQVGNLTQDVRVIKQETNWFDPVIFKTVNKMPYTIISYYYIPC